LRGEFLSIMNSLSPVLLELLLSLVHLVELISQLSNSIGVLLAESTQLALVIHVSFLQITTELGEFSLTLLVDLNLSSSGTTLLIETLTWKDGNNFILQIVELAVKLH